MAGEPLPPSTGSGQRLTPSPSTGRRNRTQARQTLVWPGMLSPLALIVGGEGLILLGFFLPWFQGDGVLALRTFSGFGLARDLHTLSTSMETVTGASLAPLMFYAIPAGTVGVAVYTLLAGVSATSRLLTLCAGIYTLAVVMVALVIALTPVTDATRLLGAPSWGLAVTAAGAMLALSGSRRRDKQDAGA